jgi:hypothetical protein
VDEKLDLDELARLARAATQGPWVVTAEHGDGNVCMAHGDYPNSGYAHWGHLRVRDAAYIAAANPETVLALIAGFREMEAEREGFKTRIRANDETFDFVSALVKTERERAERAEAAAAQMRALVARAAAAGDYMKAWTYVPEEGERLAADARALLATDAGRGYVSPEAHAAVLARLPAGATCANADEVIALREVELAARLVKASWGSGNDIPRREVDKALAKLDAVRAKEGAE